MSRLSVVVVLHDMAREAPRTLYTLSPAHQRGVTAADYEVIVVDNGSAEPLGADAVKEFGPNFRYVAVDRATPSPVPAINTGVALSAAPAVAIMVDGARMATPGAMAWGLRALDTFGRCVIATVSLHLGGFQPRAMEAGYDAAAEDELLASVDWREDGYRLFDVAAWAGSSRRGWFAPLGETNLVFQPRAVFDELGGYEEAFVLPGGGLANLDYYKRAAEMEDVEWITLLGEATFHQFHGGIATNQAEHANHRAETLRAFRDEYEAIRGRPFRRSFRAPTFFGAVTEPALRLMGRTEGDTPDQAGWRSRRYS